MSPRLLPPRRDMPLLEARVGDAPPAGPVPVTLPMSAATKIKFEQLNRDAQRLPPLGPRARSLLTPRSAYQQKYYEYSVEAVGPSEVTQALSNFTNRSLRALSADGSSFSQQEAREMVDFLSSMVSAASWMEWVLSAIGDFIPSLPSALQESSKS